MRSRRLRSDAGVTLPELLVGMIVASLVLAAGATIFEAGMKSSQTNTARTDNENDARIAVMLMSKSVRTSIRPSQLDDGSSTANAFVAATARSVQFYADLNNAVSTTGGSTVGPSQVTYSVDTANNLVQTVQKPDSATAPYTYCRSGPTCVKTTTIIAHNVDPAQPIFSYYETAGVAPFAATCGSSPCLSAADLALVNAVEIQVVLLPTPGSDIGPTTYVTRVGLPNRDAIVRDNDQ